MINYIKTSDSNIIISSRLLFNKILSKSKKKNVLTIGWEHNHYHGNLKLAKKPHFLIIQSYGLNQ